MSARGHNENAMRLGILADDASRALERVAQSEADAIDAWLAYGAALNEGRAMFPGDREFGEWVRNANLAERSGEEIHAYDRLASMWGAANRDDFEAARTAGNARTVRGIHAKWKEIEAERQEQERREIEAQKAEAEKASAISGDDQSKPEQEVTTEETQQNMGETATEAEKGTTLSNPDQEQETPDPHRKGLSGLTRDGLEDEVAGLRADLDDAKAALEAAKAEIDRLKEQARDLSSGNQGLAISRLHKQIVELKRARDNAIEKSAKEIRRANFMEKELKAARKSLESQEVEL